MANHTSRRDTARKLPPGKPAKWEQLRNWRLVGRPRPSLGRLAVFALLFACFRPQSRPNCCLLRGIKYSSCTCCCLSAWLSVLTGGPLASVICPANESENWKNSGRKFETPGTTTTTTVAHASRLAKSEEAKPQHNGAAQSRNRCQLILAGWLAGLLNGLVS